jgi:hypothetical protein
VLARFYSLRNPNQTALFEDMSRAWRLRSDMTHKSLRDNLFIITFSTEGDYKFVLQGGPWLHKGDALLVAAFDGLTCPSKIPLETVPIWIRIYDLPLVLMTKARGQLYGSRFGCVREVDVEEDGRNRHDFFRIRVDLPVKKPPKPKIAIKMHVQGKEEIKRFDVRYERIPYFCFMCGYIGHSDKECDKKGANNEVPFQFSAELRCSPLKPFERKIGKVKATQKPEVSHRLVFRGAGSANSSSSKRPQEEHWDEAIPPRVDARDGFETKEKEGDMLVDEQLASHARKLNVSAEVERTGGNRGNKSSEPSSKGEMIPAMANLQQAASFGEVSTKDVLSAQKRSTPAQSGLKKTGRVQQALIELGQEPAAMLKQAPEIGFQGREFKRFKKTDREALVGGESEATSPGAAGKLAGSMKGTRQEQ